MDIEYWVLDIWFWAFDMGYWVVNIGHPAVPCSIDQCHRQSSANIFLTMYLEI